MPRTTPQYEQAQEKRIILGAAQVFADYGYQQTTIDRIGQALQLSKGAIYIYFKSKEDLFIRVLQWIYEQRFTALAEAFQEDDSVQVKFGKILDRLCALVSHADRVFIRLWIEGFLESEHMPRLEAIKTASRQQFTQLLHGLLQEGQRAGEVDPRLNLDHATAAIMAFADGLMLHSLMPGWGIDPQRVRAILQESFSQFLVQDSPNSPKPVSSNREEA
jgi:AcrR family transcriptional regulator